jgi:hypothetical protein
MRVTGDLSRLQRRSILLPTTAPRSHKRGAIAGDTSSNRIRRARRPRHCLLGPMLSVLVLVSATAMTGQSASAQNAPGEISQGSSLEKCEFPDPIGNNWVAPENRGGEYRVKLSIGDLSSTDLIQRHLINATVLARLLTAQLVADTDGSCRAVILPTLFPDLRAYVIDTRPVASADVGSSRCGVALVKVAQSQPTPEAVKAAAAEQGKFESSWIGGTHVTAVHILVSALREIYAPYSFAHALASVDAPAYSSFDAEGFLKWLRTQQVDGGPAVSKIAICGRDVDPRDPRVDHPWERLPVSGLTAPRIIKLSTNNIGPVAIPALRHVIIVGDEVAAAGVPSSSPIFAGYCDREHAVSTVGAAHIRCVATFDYGLAPWVVLFCDPSDCSTESMAEAVMAMVAEDSAVIASGKESAVNGQPRGPYLINVETLD